MVRENSSGSLPQILHLLARKGKRITSEQTGGQTGVAKAHPEQPTALSSWQVLELCLCSQQISFSFPALLVIRFSPLPWHPLL